MPKISIIIPTYNNEKYIKECIESIIYQSFEDIEIIVVNDGSTDYTLDILKVYADNDSRIIILNIPNAGYGHAMNIGIENASGKFIGIVESDDYIEKNMYEVLLYYAEKNDCDWVKADYNQFIDRDGERIFERFNICSDEQYYKVITPIKDKSVFSAKIYSWAGIYKRDFLIENKIKHNESPGASYQDNGFWFQVMVSAKKVMFIDKVLYNLRRDNPESSIKSKEKVFCICEEYDFIYNKVLRTSTCKKEFLEEFLFYRYKSYNVHLDRIDDKYRLAFLKRYAEDFNSFISDWSITKRLFSQNDRERLQLILCDYKAFYTYKYSEFDDFIKYVSKEKIKNVFISDEIGRRIFGQLLKDNKEIDLEQIIIPNYKVLDERRKLQKFHTLKVTLLQKVKNIEKGKPILMCSASSEWESNIKLLKERKFSRIIPIIQNWLKPNQILISTIVTIYNAEKYLDKCINSLLSQTYKNIEIVLIEDGSTDESLKICQKYAYIDSRIKLLKKNNEGLVCARKSGVEIASGQYITFLDSDDWIDNDYYEKIYWRIIENSADIVATGCIKEFSESSQEVKNSIISGFYTSEDMESEIYSKMLYWGNMYKFGILQYTWNKFYKRDILVKNQMSVDNKIINGEDVACVYPCILDSNSIDVLNTCRYHYRVRNESMSNYSNINFTENAILLYRYLKKRFDNYDFRNILYWQLSHYMVYLLQVGANNAFGLKIKTVYPLEFGKLAYKSKIILVAGGERGESYNKQINTSPYCNLLKWIDCDIEKNIEDIVTNVIEVINKFDYDFIVIASSSGRHYDNFYNILKESGIQTNRIIRVF